VKKIYPSAVDAWLLILLVGIPVLFFSLGISRFDVDPGRAKFLLVQGGFLTLLMVALTVPCRYTLTDDTLEIRCGLMASSIPLAEITGAELSGNVLSAPALSFKRVKIDHAGGFALISPRNREAFIAELLTAVERRKNQRH
jgi:hypothetical protein